MYMCLYNDCAKTEAVVPLREERVIWGPVQGSHHRQEATLASVWSVCNNGCLHHVHQILENYIFCLVKFPIQLYIYPIQYK